MFCPECLGVFELLHEGRPLFLWRCFRYPPGVVELLGKDVDVARLAAAAIIDTGSAELLPKVFRSYIETADDLQPAIDAMEALIDAREKQLAMALYLVKTMVDRVETGG